MSKNELKRLYKNRAFLLVTILYFVITIVTSYVIYTRVYEKDNISWTDFDSTLFSLCPGDYEIVIYTEGDKVNDSSTIRIIDSFNNKLIGNIHLESGRKEYFYTFSAESVIEKLSVEMGSSNSGKITKMSFRSVDSLYSNAKFAVITVLFVFLLIYIGISLAFVGKFSFLIMTVYAVLISIPYIYLQLRFSMDMYFHIARVFSFSKSLSIGQFPWRIATDYLFGTGNVVADMYPNIFLFPFAFMCKKRVSFTVIWKIMMLMINILTAYMGYIGIRLVVKDKRICLVFSILLVLFLCNYNSNMYIIANNIRTGNYLSFKQIFGDTVIGALEGKSFGAVISIGIVSLFRVIKILRNDYE